MAEGPREIFEATRSSSLELVSYLQQRIAKDTTEQNIEETIKHIREMAHWIHENSPYLGYPDLTFSNTENTFRENADAIKKAIKDNKVRERGGFLKRRLTHKQQTEFKGKALLFLQEIKKILRSTQADSSSQAGPSTR